MSFVEVIAKKRDGHALSRDDINRFVQAPMQHHAALKPALVTAVDDAEAGE